MTVPMNKKVVIVLVVLASLVLFSSFATAIGCLIFPGQDDSLYCVPYDSEAQTLCRSATGCTQDNVDPNECSQVPSCQPVRCNSLSLNGCRLNVAQGYCDLINGQTVSDAEVNIYCTEGCCGVREANFCPTNINKFECQQITRDRYGLSRDALFTADPAMTPAACAALYCGVPVANGIISGFILDPDKRPINNAEVSLRGRTTIAPVRSDATGHYQFDPLPPGSYTIDAKLNMYLPNFFTGNLAPRGNLQWNITLTPSQGTKEVSGTAKTESGVALAEVTISWTGDSTGRTTTGADGKYTVSLSAGNYVLTASKLGKETSTHPLVVQNSPLPNTDFILQDAAFQGINGEVYEDNGEGILNYATDTIRFGVDIYVDGNFVGKSQYPNADFRVRATVGIHTLSARIENLEFEKTVTVREGGINQDILLTTYHGECSLGGTGEQKQVEQFAAHHVLGKKEVKLDWKKPCPEVTGYTIAKWKGETFIENLAAAPTDISLLDGNVKWGESYKYIITATYQSGLTSNPPSEDTIQLGNELCENKYHTPNWETFCLIDNTETVEREDKKVYSCDEENQVIYQGPDCTALDASGQLFFCARESSTQATCKNIGACEYGSAGSPFGLYYSRDACYGTATPENGGSPNFCYYDSTNSIVNKCNSCINTATGKIATCFDYNSKDACEVNTCSSTPCQWADGASNTQSIDYSRIFPDLTDIPAFVTAETGAGYCTPVDYKKDDACSLCGPSATVFENYFCTAQICQNLGRCYSNPPDKGLPLSSCSSCGEYTDRSNNCYSYTTETECNGEQNIQKSISGEITFSQDTCGWKRCTWSGTAGGAGICVKDGDADSVDDCVNFGAGELASCRADTSAPRTTIVAEDTQRTQMISLAHPVIMLRGDDTFHTQGYQKNPLGNLFYCITSAEPTAPDACLDHDGVSAFQFISYSGRRLIEDIGLNLIEGINQKINGKKYRLKFYSTDKYHNQEKIQEGLVFIDNVPPDFEIAEINTAVGDTTELSVYLTGNNEPMSCTFNLEQIFPTGEAQHVLRARADQKAVVFDNVHGVRYDLNVTCSDDQDNNRSKAKYYVFDLQQKIDVIYPPVDGAVSSNSLSFQVNTLVGARCSLYKTANNEFVTDFITDNVAKVHHTIPIPGFIEKEYPAEYKVVCEDLLTQEQLEDYFNFRVDFTPPEVTISLREDSRIEEPSGYGWEEFFIRSAEVSLQCSAEGFPCEDTFYCLGEGCESPAR